MKRIIIAISCLLLAVGCSDSTNYVPKSAEMADFPRLFMPAGMEDDLKQNVAQEPFWSQVNDMIMAEADVMLNKPALKHNVKGRRLLAVSRDAVARVTYMSYAYRMTGDVRYAQRAEQDMLTVSGFKDWNPSHFLDVAEMTTALAIGYDWLNSYLSEQSKDSIANAIIENGLKVSLIEDNYDHWVENVNNWNQVCHTGLSLGALVVWEREPALARQILNRAVNNIRIPLANYAPDGAYAEGPNYWEYGTLFNILLIDALNSNLGTDYGLSALEGFEQSVDYASQMITPKGYLFNYGDSPMRKLGFYVAPFWFAREFDNPNTLYSFFHNMELSKHRFLPLAVIWGSSFAVDKTPAPETRMWKAEGSIPVAVMRKGYDDNAEAQYVGVKLGKAGISHAHLDMGSFFYEAYGVRWAIDLGAESYDKMENCGLDVWNKGQDSQRWLVYKHHNRQHNVCTINDAQQNVGERADFISTSQTADSLSVTGVLTDLYTPYIKAYNREVTLMDEGTLYIRDNWTTGKKFTHIDWTMMTEASASLQGDDLLLTKNGVSLLLKAKSNSSKAAKGYWSIEPYAPVYEFDSFVEGITKVVYKIDLDLKTENTLEIALSKVCQF